MSEKIITPIDLKVPSEENLRRIISILKGLMAQTSEISEQCIIEFDPETIYTNGRACFKDGNLYLAITTHQGAWDNRHFEVVDGTTIEYLSKQNIEDLFNIVAPEMWDYLGGIISDEISTKKTWHSSRIYEELMDVYTRSVEYTIKYNARQQKASYKVITREAEVVDTQFIYLIKDGDGYQMWILTDDGALNIGSTNIDMSEYYTRDEVDVGFLKQTDAAITYATNDKIDGIIKDETSTTTNTYSSNKIDSLLREKVNVAENKTMQFQHEDTKLNVSVNDINVGSLGYLSDGALTEGNTWSGKYINTQLGALTPKSNIIPSGTDLNKYFANGVNPSTAAIQSWTNVPTAFKTTNQGEAMIQWIPYNPEESYGTQILTSQAVGAGTVGEWRRCYDKSRDSWTPWKTIIDPWNDGSWVDLASQLTPRADITIDRFRARRQNGVVFLDVILRWSGPHTTSTQSGVITGIPRKYCTDMEFLMTGYHTDNYVGVAQCRIAEVGGNLCVDENDWPTGTVVKCATSYVGIAL